MCTKAVVHNNGGEGVKGDCSVSEAMRVKNDCIDKESQRVPLDKMTQRARRRFDDEIFKDSEPQQARQKGM